jgi:hypothetical protein
LAVLVALGAPLHAEEDPIAEKLDAVRLQYHEEIERLRTELTQALQDKEDAARKAGDVALVERVKTQREMFNLSDALPSVVSPERYKRGITKAKFTLKTAVQTGVKEYLAAKQDDLAAGLQEELQELQAALAPPPRKPKADNTPEPEPQVIAVGVHQATNGGKQLLRAEFKLFSNGRINSPDSGSSWTRQGRILTMRWQNPEAPGGAWVDIATLSEDGRSFKGRNQVGTEITGLLSTPQRESKKSESKK